MKIIPVFDLMGGRLVHAIAGERDKYLPLNTKLIPKPCPQKACGTLKAHGFELFYAADLDAITGRGNNFKLIEQLILNCGINIWLDAGIKKIPHHLPFDKNIFNKLKLIAGSETILSLDMLKALINAMGAENLVFSLDLKDGRILSPNQKLSKTNPLDLAIKVFNLGIKNIIVLNLGAVGKNAGPDKNFLYSLKKTLPEALLFPGGGLRNNEDLVFLKKLGAAGVLVATSLYNRMIDAKPEI